MKREQKIAFGETRESSVRRVVVYCADSQQCGRSITLDDDERGVFVHDRAV